MDGDMDKTRLMSLLREALKEAEGLGETRIAGLLAQCIVGMQRTLLN